MSISKYILRSKSLGSSTSMSHHPDMSVRYSRQLLLLGGVAATLAVGAFFFVSGTMLFINFFQEQTNVFENQCEKIKEIIYLSQDRLKQAADSYELKRHIHQHAGDTEDCNDKEPEYQPAVRGVDSKATATATFFSLLNYDIVNKKMIGGTQLMSKRSAMSVFRSWDAAYILSSFVYSTDHKLLALSPPLTVEQMSNFERYDISNYVSLIRDMVDKQLSMTPPALIRQNRIVWLPIYKYPVTSELIAHSAAPIYCGEEQIAVIVEALPVDRFSILFKDPQLESGFFLLSRNFNHVLGAGGNPADDRFARLALEYKADFDKAGKQTVLIRRGSIFIYSKVIPGPDWIAIYIVDLYGVAIALKKTLINNTVLMVFIVSAIWALILFFDRLVLVPLKVQTCIINDSDEFNRVVLNTAPVALTIYEPTNNIVILQNEQAIKLLDLSCEGEGLYKRVLHEGGFWSDADYALRRPFEASEVRVVEVEIHDEAGNRREISVTYSKARYKQVAVVLFGMTDVSEQKATVRYLQQAKEFADKANNAKSIFLATMSHEIRTPLHGALGNLELLALEQLTHNQRARVSTIQHAFDSLLALVNDVLDLSKIEAEEFKLNTELFHLDEVIERCARTFSPDILRKRLRFLCLIDPRLVGSWSGDAKRISQVLMNLLSNAQKFTQLGAITLRVTPGKLEGNTQWVKITVSDTGIGIAQVGLKNLFEPFAQANQTIAGRFGGTGLGLALCRRITTLMGGHITVDSELDVGSLFTVYLPLKMEEVICPEPAAVEVKGFNTIILVCDTPLWELNLVEHISVWLPDVNVIMSDVLSEPTINCQSAILVFALAGNLPLGWKGTLRNKYVDIVNISAEGPLYPERRIDGLHVTSFSSSVLKLALLACAGSENVDELSIRQDLSSVTSRDARVLVAEDDILSRQLLKCQLNALGYQNVDCVTNGAEALDRCLTYTYEVVITDLGMPIMDGYTLIKRLRAEGIRSPVIISTADVGEELCSTYNFETLHKPTTMEQLSLVIEKVLGRVEFLNESIPLGAISVTTMAELRALFLVTWNADANALRDALRTCDNKRLLGLLHRLKGALLVLNEWAATEMCDELQVCLETNGTIPVWPKINAFIDNVDFIVSTFESPY